MSFFFSELNINRPVILYWFFLFPFSLLAQDKKKEYQYFGVISISEEQFIPYSLYFSCENYRCTGFSVSDIKGINETKSSLEGIYDPLLKAYKFKELKVLSTRASAGTYDEFCFVEFNLPEKVIKKPLKYDRIQEEFKAYFKDGEECGRGEMNLLFSEKINKQIERIQTKIIEKNSVQKLLGDSVISLLSDEMNALKQKLNESHEITSKTVAVTKDTRIFIKDIGVADGDTISVTINDNTQILVPNENRVELRFTDPVNEINLKGINEGKRPLIPLELMIRFSNQTYSLDTISLQKDQEYKLILER